MFPTDDPLKAVRKLYPKLPDSELEKIKEFLDEYASVTWRIYQRLKQENPEIIAELRKQRRKKER